jgi:hypothetical protein
MPVPLIAGLSYRPADPPIPTRPSASSTTVRGVASWPHAPRGEPRGGAELHDSTERPRARAVEKAPEFDRTRLGHLWRPRPLWWKGGCEIGQGETLPPTAALTPLQALLVGHVAALEVPEFDSLWWIGQVE